jgi:hypothetical protein
VSEFVEAASEKAAAREFALEHAHERIALRQAAKAFHDMSNSPLPAEPSPSAADFAEMDFSDRPLAPISHKLMHDFEEQWLSVTGAQQMR